MLRYGLIFALIFSAVSSVESYAQIKIIPQQKLDSVVNVPTVKGDNISFKGGQTISFGTINEDDSVWSTKVEWSNKSDKPLVITSTKTSCSCLQAVVRRETVASGGGSVIELKYNPKGHPGDVEQRVFIYTNLSSSQPTTVLKVKGVVKPSLNHSKDYPCNRGELLLRRDTVEFAGDKPQTERIACMNNSSRVMLLEADTLLSSRGLRLKTEPEVLVAGQEGDLVITYTPESDSKKPLWLKLYIKGLALPPRAREIVVQIKKEEK